MTKKGSYMKKENLTDEHLIFQDAAKAFFEKEMKPNNEQWEKDGMVSRDIWLKAGSNNFFGIDFSRYGLTISFTFFWSTFDECCVEITMDFTLIGFPFS